MIVQATRVNVRGNRSSSRNRRRERLAASVGRYRIEPLENRILLTTWYVSTSTGLNSNPGSAGAPFQTIQAAANVAEPGDTVLIQGGVYHETVVPAHSGTAAAPITYEPYGGSVTIDGADTITGWTQYSGDIYEAPMNWDLGDGNNQVFAYGGQMLTEARWPNTSLDPMLINTATIASTNAAAAKQDTPNSCTIYNSQLTQPAGYWVGATMHVSPGQQWVWQTGTVTASSPGSITYSYTQLTPYEDPRAGNPFYLTGKFSQLDSPGEWYHDSTTNTLYVWMPDNSVPTNTDVEAKHREYAWDLSGLSWINIFGIAMKGASINTSATSSHIELSLISALFISQQMDNPYPWIAKSTLHDTGIIMDGSYITLTQSYLAYSSGDAVFMSGSHNSVVNNTIIDADYFVGEEAGISIQGSNQLVSHNNINNTGRSGITFYFTTDVDVMNNLLYNIGQRATDCGGIYTYGTNAAGSRVAYNEIFNLVYNDDICVKMNDDSVGDDFFDNTFIGTLFLNGAVTTTIAIAQGSTPMASNCLMQNNIFVGAASFLAGITQNHNTFLATAAAAASSFVNMAANNYQLAAGASAINAGVVVAPYTNGYVGAAPDAPRSTTRASGRARISTGLCIWRLTSASATTYSPPI